jgi:hypothetical protein
MTNEDKLGELVEFLNYVVIFSETSKTFTAYSPSYPEIRSEGIDENNTLSNLKTTLSELALD